MLPGTDATSAGLLDRVGGKLSVEGAVGGQSDTGSTPAVQLHVGQDFRDTPQHEAAILVRVNILKAQVSHFGVETVQKIG